MPYHTSKIIIITTVSTTKFVSCQVEYFNMHIQRKFLQCTPVMDTGSHMNQYFNPSLSS